MAPARLRSHVLLLAGIGVLALAAFPPLPALPAWGEDEDPVPSGATAFPGFPTSRTTAVPTVPDDDSPRRRAGGYPIPLRLPVGEPQGAVGPDLRQTQDLPANTTFPPRQVPATPRGTPLPASGSTPSASGAAATPGPATTPAPGSLAGSPWMATAFGQTGVREGAGMSETIGNYHASAGGRASESTHWCSSFVNWTLAQHGITGTGSKRAMSWARWGVDAGGPVRGSIVVFSNGDGTGHVGFVDSVNADGTLNVLGGNQSNAVRISRFSTGKVVGYRLPPGYTGSGSVTGNGTQSLETNTR